MHITTDEQSRLNAVRRFMDIGDTMDKDLDEVVNLAAEICGTPMSLITLLDENMQWFKAKKGLNITATTREQSFCKFTIEQGEIMEVPDALLDSRVKDLDVVQQDPKIRFYAGATLTTHDGHNLGTLCVLDTHPRQLNHTQLHTLKVLARQVVNMMELSQSVVVLEEQHQQALQTAKDAENSQIELRAVFDSSSELFVLLGKHLDILSFNKATFNHFFKVTGREIKIGDFISDYMESSVLKKFIRYYSAALGGSRLKSELYIRKDTPYAEWVETSYIPVRSGDKILGVAINAVDITSRKRHEHLIKVQNEALSRIATMQSHEIRKPVATLMGLMELIKLESRDGTPDNGYLDMITATVNELNDKICGIVADSEVTLNTKMSDINSLD